MTKQWKYLIIGFYALTRMVVWIFRPAEFTEIIYSYMPYAHRWAGGEIPYLEQWYEYPPWTIPLFFAPHLIDMASLNTPIHIHYLTAYRGLMLGVDLMLFVLVWKALGAYRASQSVLVGGLLYYSITTAKANHFLYDSMDLTFAAAMTLSVVAPLIWKKRGVFGQWIGFFLATALKYINAPLGLVYFFSKRYSIRKRLFNLVLAGAIVWLVPLLYFRSSLQVSFVYHSLRGLQVESVPAQIVAVVNSFTHSEEYVEVYKNYDIVGPVSTQIKKVFDVLFPLSLIGVSLYGVVVLVRTKKKISQLAIHIVTLLYIFVFMLFAKVLSTPFLLWHIPLLATYPFKSLASQLKLTIPSLFMIVISMTGIPNIPVGTLNTHILIGVIRTGIIAYLGYQSLSMARQARGRVKT